ncbi:MAG: redoxin domain-containing protein [Planctomycetaceae bacterium]|nr:redoxin domain-containing protein [Planctomycetaceae bacterium]
MDRRFLVPLFLGIGLVGLCVWRINTNKPQTLSEQLQRARIERPAENFEGVDIHNTMFRLERYLGRHRVLVVFFSALETAANDPGLLAVRDAFPLLSKNDVKVVGVSTALPQDNRRAIETAGDFPFPLISDPDESIHRRWSRIDPQTQQPRSGVFLIDRKGTVATLGGIPQPAGNVTELLQELTR